MPILQECVEHKKFYWTDEKCSQCELPVNDVVSKPECKWCGDEIKDQVCFARNENNNKIILGYCNKCNCTSWNKPVLS